MKVLEAVPTLRVPDAEVLVAGDWHGSTTWVESAYESVSGLSDTLLHVGDFGLWDDFLPAVDSMSAAAGVSRNLVTPGNHENWGALTDLFDAYPGCAVRISQTVCVLPRGFRFTLGTARRTVLSLGGAPSIDFESACPGRDWWPEEAITSEDVHDAIARGSADLMLTHDTVNGSGVLPVEMTIITNPLGVSSAAIDYAATGRRRLTEVWDAVRPDLLIHGHYHLRGAGARHDGRRVEALARDGEPGNMALLNTTTFELTDLPILSRYHRRAGDEAAHV